MHRRKLMAAAGAAIVAAPAMAFADGDDDRLVGSYYGTITAYVSGPDAARCARLARRAVLALWESGPRRTR